ncbi:hypothetical protein G7046_g3137 [Stylonectria norvegica]|nr:hypothetical protein G7046_g3137 [Stylonectria norvegica]
MAAELNPTPEVYFIRPTPHVPNSKLPVVVYRKALLGHTDDSKIQFIHNNGWEKTGQWGPYDVAHFHSTIHEAYVVLRGRGTYILGKSPIDPDVDEDGQENGLRLPMEDGDVFVLPSGVAHALINPEDDWQVASFCPEGSPPYDMNFCKDGAEETAQKAADCEKVPIPNMDPVFGVAGPLHKAWLEAQSA